MSRVFCLPLVVVVAGLIIAGDARAADVTADNATYGFTSLASEPNPVTVGWFFNGSVISQGNQTLNGVHFTEVTGGTSSGALSWDSAALYSLAGDFNWTGTPDATIRSAMSNGGLWSGDDRAMSLHLAAPAGTPYTVELVSLQPSNSDTRTMDISVDGLLLKDDWSVPAESFYNKLLRFTGISDGSVDIAFTAGGSGDPAPAISIVTFSYNAVPEAGTAILGLAAMLPLLAHRRRPNAKPVSAA